MVRVKFEGIIRSVPISAVPTMAKSRRYLTVASPNSMNFKWD